MNIKRHVERNDFMNKHEYEAVDKLQKFLLVLYKDFKELAIDEKSINLKEMTENGIASAIGAMELIKLNGSEK